MNLNADLALELLHALRELRDELRAARLRAEPVSRPLHVADRRALDRLLPVVAAQFAEAFEVWELFDSADMPGVVGNDMRLGLGDLTAHRLGKLLRRAADSGTAVAGWRVEAAGRHGAGGRWRLIADPSAFSGS
jgi:hypothetical protein